MQATRTWPLLMRSSSYLHPGLLQDSKPTAWVWNRTITVLDALPRGKPCLTERPPSIKLYSSCWSVCVCVPDLGAVCVCVSLTWELLLECVCVTLTWELSEDAMAASGCWHQVAHLCSECLLGECLGSSSRQGVRGKPSSF